MENIIRLKSNTYTAYIVIHTYYRTFHKRVIFIYRISLPLFARRNIHTKECHNMLFYFIFAFSKFLLITFVRKSQNFRKTRISK